MKSDIIVIDCLQGLKNLDTNSVSMVLTDPPYFIDGMDNTWDNAKIQKKIKKGHVIGGMPVGMKFDTKQSQRLRDFFAPVSRELKRVTKAGGFILCFSQPRLSHACAMAMEEQGIEIRDLLAWKRSGQAKAFTQDHFIKRRTDLSNEQKQDIITRLGGRKTPQLRPEIETIILGQVPKEGTFTENFLEHGVGLIDPSKPLINPGQFPSTLLPEKRDKKTHGHPTAKPVRLLRHLIRIFGGEKPIVLDPFAGCGSTGVACILESCSFIGFERDRSYAKMATERISNAKA